MHKAINIFKNNPIVHSFNFVLCHFSLIDLEWDSHILCYGILIIHSIH